MRETDRDEGVNFTTLLLKSHQVFHSKRPVLHPLPHPPPAFSALGGHGSLVRHGQGRSANDGLLQHHWLHAHNGVVLRLGLLQGLHVVAGVGPDVCPAVRFHDGVWDQEDEGCWATPPA